MTSVSFDEPHLFIKYNPLQSRFGLHNASLLSNEISKNLLKAVFHGIGYRTMPEKLRLHSQEDGAIIQHHCFPSQY